MSNIPAAQKLIAEAIRLLKKAAPMLPRRKPKFRARKENSKLTPQQKRYARRLRRQGYSVYRIAKMLNTNHGRISEAVSGKAH